MGRMGHEGGRECGEQEREKKVGPDSTQPGGFPFSFSISISFISFFF
jgi:hypothetical protein